MGDYFIIGGGSLQKDFVKLVKNNGYTTHVFDYNPNCVCAKIADVFHCISIDAKETILEIAKEYKPVAVQTVATELGNITACYIGEKLGLKNCSYQTALKTTDKSLMKEVFLRNSIPTAQFYKVSNFETIDISQLEFPVVVKASDRSAGRGVSLARNAAQFNVAFKEAYEESNNKIVLIEEYLEGKQFSIESISYEGSHQIVAVTEEFTTGSPYFIECFHLIPARIEEPLYSKFVELTIKILAAFEIDWGASHIELMITKNGIKIIEVASRMGGLRDKMICLAKGTDYLQLIFNASIGKNPVIKSTHDYYSIVKMILDDEDYRNYQHLKEHEAELLKIDDVNKNIHFNKKAKSLMDSQGFYYLQITNEREIDKYLN